MVRPAKKVPAHRRVLAEKTYEDFVALNGGDFCWIGRAVGAACGADRDPASRRLHRDHDHSTEFGTARGLLCFPHNKLLARAWTPDLLRAALAYLLKGLGDQDPTLRGATIPPPQQRGATP